VTVTERAALQAAAGCTNPDDPEVAGRMLRRLDRGAWLAAAAHGADGCHASGQIRMRDVFVFPAIMPLARLQLSNKLQLHHHH
jgi:hypothetical protein